MQNAMEHYIFIGPSGPISAFGEDSLDALFNLATEVKQRYPSNTQNVSIESIMDNLLEDLPFIFPYRERVITSKPLSLDQAN